MTHDSETLDMSERLLRGKTVCMLYILTQYGPSILLVAFVYPRC